jgi:D-alanyl-D-alanine carboxypeptidase/D-alanyl-D-alanine-endopeptidase (penicillin-binding protein 4)
VDRRSVPDGEEVVLDGAVALGSEPHTFQRSVLDPARYAGALLVAQLEAVGISVRGEMRMGSVPQGAVRMTAFSGAPLSDVLRRFLKYSNNQIGEALVKELGTRATGRPGTWESGTAAVRAQLAAAGLPLDGSVLVDGSGLSQEDRASPRLLVAALRAARGSFDFGAEFEAALPIAGTDGTLKERAEAAQARVRAKTGLLTRVTALSGYAHLASGERVVFSILVNGFRTSAEAAMHAVDGFAAALVTEKTP